MKWTVAFFSLLSTSAMAAETCNLTAGNRYEARYDYSSNTIPGGVWVEENTSFADLICQTDKDAAVRRSFSESELAGKNPLLGSLNKLRAEGYVLVSCSGSLKKEDSGPSGRAPVSVLRETYQECLLTK